jgi:elongation factor G
LEANRIVQVISIVITPKVVGDQALTRALASLAGEDPAIRFRSDSETGRCMLAGVSERHLEIIVDRLKREFGIEAALDRPTVFFKSALSNEAIGEYKHLDASGGRQQYAHVKIRLSPRPDGAGYLFDNQIFDHSIPSRFIPAIEQGIDDARGIGVGGGYPVDDVRVELCDGSYHDADSTESAFRSAARQAFFEGATRATPKVVEPVMRIVIAVPEEFLADVLTDLDRRCAEIQSSDSNGEWRNVVARAPFGRLFGYTAELTHRSRGRATCSLHFASYQQRDSFSDDGDRDSLVGAPLRPIVPSRESAIALPEPDEDDNSDERWPQPRS